MHMGRLICSFSFYVGQDLSRMFRSEELRWRDEPQRRWREEERRDEQQWRGQLRWRDERWPAERWHNKHWRGERWPHSDDRQDDRRRYNDCRCRGERDYYDRHDDWHHDPRLDHDRRDQYQHQWQPHQHSNRRMGLPILNDEQQSHDALMRNERPSSSHCANGSGQVDPLKLTAYISHAGSADALLALFAAHSTSLNHIHAANLWNKLGKQRIERRHEERLEQLVQRTLHLVSSDSLARDPSIWSEEERSQLHQWQLWLSLERGADGQQYLLSESQRKLCCDAMQGTEVTISRLQRSVAAALATLQHGFEEEYLEPRTGYSLDLALPSSRVGVEVDGPSHFLLPDGRGVRKPNGPTLLKRRLLAAAGWSVISVPFYEWYGLIADERQAYLERAVAPLCSSDCSIA
ncbi:hypothetical protein EMIHUDRAFT_233394 [Emiliania huxleyi CCMP1516]|uniref:RAP domain-containing protein n=2 Tax=Emiliania huxleyi TaxID=2903 RepID=A0A0D3K254_EMIH1|nr:hypothetical protein EMIHUDRAFT_233394 [Emiliania huxleyi CCMP1516]EOD29839.1 hypothetical protein EMIHUDRAFT_233394 [Emiliania huxleyi CCMP1516]|eukprot:XP_005782268.1 hypothetical protein EMIHUDRAFT_233394 [Emiliania huxleyi CCMP1516]